MSHANAPLTVEGRRRLCLRVDAGRPRAHVAAEAGVSRQCLSKWHARWRANGEAGLADHSSRPAHSPDRVPLDVQGRIERLRSPQGPGIRERLRASASWARPESPPNCALTVCRSARRGCIGCWSGWV